MQAHSLLLCADEGDRQIVRQILADYRNVVDVCSNGDEAYAMLLRRTFRSVIVDCDAPDAKWFFESLRLHAPHRNAVKVAIVGPEVSTSDSFALGASCVMHKPLTMERAERSLRALHVLSNRERRTAERFTVHLRATCCFSPASLIEASVLDMSETGMLVHFPGSQPQHKTGLIHVEDPENGEQLVDCAGQLAWMDEYRRAGVRFLGMDAKDRLHLREWLRAQGAPEAVKSAPPVCLQLRAAAM
jgi:DNA-binding NarL/FixJ family response regulator